MSIIDFNKRHTLDWDEMHKHMSSPDSLVFIATDENIITCPTSIDLKVGEAYIIPGSNHTFAIPKKGLEVKPHHSVVVYTSERLKLPYNVFGVVTGKGSFIFRGCFLSTGKIDPAFDGKLKIGFYNGGNRKIILHTGDSFATAYFLNTDSTLTAPLSQYQTELSPDLPLIKWYNKYWMYVKEHWISFLAWLILTAPAAFYYSLESCKIINVWLSRE